jgi:hypothetical protein
MAQKTIVTLIDDLDGSKADETVSFSLDGTAYEIDLSKANAARLRDDFASWVGHARKAGRVPSGRNGARRRTAVGPDPTAVRVWARSNGIKVSERGRVPASVIEQFVAAGN